MSMTKSPPKSLTNCRTPGCTGSPVAHGFCMPHYVRIRRALKRQGINPTNIKDLGDFAHLAEKAVNTRGREDKMILTRIPVEQYEALEARAAADGISVYEMARNVYEMWFKMAAPAPRVAGPAPKKASGRR